MSFKKPLQLTPIEKLGHQPVLGPPSHVLDVDPHELEDVVVLHPGQLEDLALHVPRVPVLLRLLEDLDGHALAGGRRVLRRLSRALRPHPPFPDGPEAPPGHDPLQVHRQWRQLRGRGQPAVHQGHPHPVAAVVAPPSSPALPLVVAHEGKQQAAHEKDQDNRHLMESVTQSSLVRFDSNFRKVV